MKMKALAIIMMMLLPLGLSFITVTKASAGTEIKYDDGSWEDHWNIAPAYKVGELFTKSDLPYSENLLVTVELYIYAVDSSDPQNLTMFILDSNFNVMASMSTPPLVVGWNNIDVSSYGLVFADNFTIGVQWLLSDGVTRTQVRLGLDLDLPQNWNHTYEYNTDHWPNDPHWGPSYNASAAENGNWMIRAVVDPAHDVAVTNVTPYGNWTYQGWSMNVNVTTTNLGDFTENVTLTLTYGVKVIIGTETVLDLVPNETRTLAFTWNTAGVDPYYNGYTITAFADISPLVDSNLTNNVLQSPTTVVVRIPGDINGDGSVNVLDAIQLGNYFGLQQGNPGWNANADMNQDGKVNILDMIMLAEHFGESANALPPEKAPKV